MKRFFLLPLLTLFLLNAAKAQNLNFGVKAGPQLATFTHTTNSKSVLRYHIGAFGTIDLMDRLQGQAELVLSATGANNTQKDYYKQRTMFLTLPLLAKYRVYDRLSVHSGLQFGWMLSSKLKIGEGNLAGTYDQKDKFNTFEIAYALGAEYLITKHLSAGLRFNWGLTKLAKDYDDPRHNTIQLFAAYRLRESEF